MATAVLTGTPARAVNKWFVALAVAAGALLEIIDTSIVNVALTDMQNSFGATLSEVSWVVSSYAIANVIILPLSAWLGMRFGKKRYFTASLIGFTAASALCGLAQNLPMLIVARVLQGLMGGGLLAKAQAILFETFPKEEQASAQGFFGAIVIAGPTIGPTLGGWLTTNVGWRWIFYINLPIGIAAVLMTLAALPDDEPGRSRSQIDWLSLALLAVGIGSLQTFLEEGNSELWFESPLIIMLAIAAAVALVAFVYRQLQSKEPVVDLRVLRHRSLWAGSILSVILGFSLYGAIFAVPVFAQSILGFTSQQTGMLLLPSALASAFMMPIGSALTKRFDPRVLLVIGGLILTASMVLLGRMSPQTGVDSLFWPLILRSFGTVLMFLPLSMATLGPIPKHEIAKASGFYNLTRQLGGSIGVAILSLLLERREAFHRSVLVEKLSSIDPAVTERVRQLAAGFVRLGSSLSEAMARAYKVLDHAVNLQAQVISFGDCFIATSVLVLVTLPLVLLLGRSDSSASIDAGH
jgi:DHA2 family multidrug resistance protein